MTATSCAPVAPAEDLGLGGFSNQGAPSPSCAAVATVIAPAGEAPTAARPAANTIPGAAPGKAARATRETVLWSHWWTPSLLSIRVTRDPAFRFTPGHYARLGIADSAGHVLFRPLSLASAPTDPYLEFFCSLVPGGQFSGRLATLRIGDLVEVDRASFGFLTLDSLAPGADLWLLASGTGLAPFLSILRDPSARKAFDHIVVVHSVRHAAELAYAQDLEHYAGKPPTTAGRAALTYVPVVTREPGVSMLSERIPALLASGSLARAVGLRVEPAHSRVMACGNPDLMSALRAVLGERGFRTARRAVRGHAAFEKYW